MNRRSLTLSLLALLPLLPCRAQDVRLAELAALPENRKLELGDWALLSIEEKETRPGRLARKIKEEQLWVIERIGENGTLMRVEVSDRNTWIVLPYRADEALRGLHLLFILDDRFTDALKNSRPGDLLRPAFPLDHIGLKVSDSKDGRRFEGSGERPGGEGDRFEIKGDLTAEAGLLGLSKASYEIKTKARKSFSREIKCLSQGHRGEPLPDFDFGDITEVEKRARFSPDPLAGLKLGIAARFAVKDVRVRAGAELNGEQVISIELVDDGARQAWKITPVDGKSIISEGSIRIPESERSARRPTEFVRALKVLCGWSNAELPVKKARLRRGNVGEGKARLSGEELSYDCEGRGMKESWTLGWSSASALGIVRFECYHKSRDLERRLIFTLLPD